MSRATSDPDRRHAPSPVQAVPRKAVLPKAVPLKEVLGHEADEAALEPFCGVCAAAVGIFTRLGPDWRHYAGNPLTRDVRPYQADHNPVIAWRPATGPVAIVAL